MLETIAAYERGEAGAGSVMGSVELHEPALETVPDEARQKLHDLSARVIMQDVSAHEEGRPGVTPSRQALQELKSLLRSVS